MLSLAEQACMHHSEDRSSWKHNWMCLTEYRADRNPAIWVYVNEILLESTNEALILDCCIMPVDRLGDVASAQHGSALEVNQFLCGEAGVQFMKVKMAAFCVSAMSTEKDMLLASVINTSRWCTGGLFCHIFAVRAVASLRVQGFF